MPEYNPTNIPYGNEADVVIDGITYVPENIDTNYTTKEINRENRKGIPSGFVLRPDKRSGTMTLQLETASSQLPEEGQTFSYDLGRGTITGVLTKVGNARGQNADWKVTCDFRLSEPFVD